MAAGPDPRATGHVGETRAAAARSKQQIATKDKTAAASAAAIAVSYGSVAAASAHDDVKYVSGIEEKLAADDGAISAGDGTHAYSSSIRSSDREIVISR
jgi:hypothetical protein